MIEWQDRAPCFQHQELQPEAWFQVRQGKPEGKGLDALATCQRACPVAESCYQWYASWTGGTPINVIAGGGWWDGKGVWRVKLVQELPGLNPYRSPAKYARALQKQQQKEEAAA